MKDDVKGGELKPPFVEGASSTLYKPLYSGGDTERKLSNKLHSLW